MGYYIIENFDYFGIKGERFWLGVFFKEFVFF